MREGSHWNEFVKKLDSILNPTLDKQVILFGSSPSSEFLRWFYEVYYGKTIKCIVDRWASDNHDQVLHMMSLYYLYDDKDIIINTLPSKLGPELEFSNIGEDWSKTGYQKEQVIHLWDEFYDIQTMASENRPGISYYDYLESEKGIDLLTSIRRSEVKGKSAHGYYPTDFRLIYTAFELEQIFKKDKAILDIGCGKGAGMIALQECGFHRIGGVEYTEEIYNTLIQNIQRLDFDYQKLAVENASVEEPLRAGIHCYLGDASSMLLQLDQFDYYFFFNPFSYELSVSVFRNIIESLKRKPRKVKVFYAEPIGHQFLLESGYFTLEKTLGDKLGGITYYANIYESIIS